MDGRVRDPEGLFELILNCIESRMVFIWKHDCRNHICKIQAIRNNACDKQLSTQETNRIVQHHGIWSISSQRSFLFQSFSVFYSICHRVLGIIEIKSNISTAWKVFVFGVFLVLILPHLDRIRRDAESVFSPNAGKYGPWRTFFMQGSTRCVNWKLANPCVFKFSKCYFTRTSPCPINLYTIKCCASLINAFFLFLMLGNVLGTL